MSIEQSLRKLARAHRRLHLGPGGGRPDAAPAQADQHSPGTPGDFEDVFIIAKGPTGDEVDRFLGEAIERPAASGRLAEIYSRLHRPYVEWQPQPLPAADGDKTP